MNGRGGEETSSPPLRSTPYPDSDVRDWIALLKPRLVVGVGGFAAKRAQIALAGMAVKIGCILHPSPASPKANTGWAKLVEQELTALGVRRNHSHC